MRIVTLALLLLLLPAADLLAQQYAWSRKISGNQPASHKTTYMDAAGNSYTVGSGTGNFDIDPGPGVTNVALTVTGASFVSKLNPAGNFLWGTALQASIADLILAADGSIYLMGRFEGSVDFDPGTGITTVASLGELDGFIVKLDASGSFQWVARLGGAGNDCVMEAAETSNGEVMVTGFFEGNVDFDPGPGTSMQGSAGYGAFRWRLTPGGILVNVVTVGAGGLGGGTAMGYAVQTDAAGDIYLAGLFRGTVVMAPPSDGTITSASSTVDDFFIAKFSPGGGFIWVKQFTGIQLESSINTDPLAVDMDGRVLLGGRLPMSAGAADLDPGPGTNMVTSAGSDDLFILKLDSTGNHLWGHLIGGVNSDAVRAVALDASGNAYAVGSFRGTVDFDPGPATFPFIGSMISAYVLKLNSVGAFQWAGAFPSSLNVISGGIGAAPNGDLVISGQFASTIDADPGPGNVPLSPSSFGDVYIIRLQAGTTATPEIAAEHDGFVLYPNPADDRIITRSSEVLQNARLTVLDAMGHTVMAMPCSGLEAQLATTGLADGLYVLEVRTADRVLTSQRFVVRH